LIVVDRADWLEGEPAERCLAAQHHELVTQDEDLQFLGGVAMASRARSRMERHSVR
jgi:hypothetical protein